MSARFHSLTAAAVAVLQTPDPARKADLTRAVAEAWRDGRLSEIGDRASPARPARPPRPMLVPPRAVPRRRIGPSPAGRIALLHALAHIELNAIDLAWDLISRFAAEAPARDFCDDWVTVAVEEATHFGLLRDRLTALGAAYGDLPAHGGLWDAADHTRGDLLARLAVVPLVLEARGLDVTPAMIERLETAGDRVSAKVLETIYADEIGHVAIGKRWFDTVCAARGLPPTETWRILVRRHFKGALKPPFNEAARARAGLSPALYAGLEQTTC